MKQADIEKSWEEAREEASKAKAIRSRREAELNSQEEDLAAREATLAATLCGKDEEVEKLAAARTQELEHKHKEALDT